MRCMDDVLIVTTRSPPEPVKEAVKKLTQEFFYGPTLRLEKDEDWTPFGFEIRCPGGGGMTLKQDLKYRCDVLTSWRRW